MTTLTETLPAGGFIVSEQEGYYCREAVTYPASQTILPGQVLGSTVVGVLATSSAVADAGNTGNGVITLDASTPVLAAARDGTYRAVCIAVATNGGTFAIEDPEGHEIGRVAVGATFANQVKFVIADGATDFAPGDAFSILVGVESPGDLQHVPLNLTATDGSQRAVALAVYPVTTGVGETRKGAAVVRGPFVGRAADITWPGGITAPQKAAAVAQLERRGILLR